MSLTPVVPASGLAGWRFLNRTYDAQFQAFAGDPGLNRDVAGFLTKIGTIETASDLVSDRSILKVALGAFGLDNDLSNRFLIQKILEDGTEAPDALANRLSDSRYRALSDAFGFGPGRDISTGQTAEMTRITDQFLSRSFEVAVGQQDNDLRLALNFQRELPELADRNVSDDTLWFSMMGTPPLRKVFETALNFPSSVGQLDIDKQLKLFRDKSQDVLGTNSFSEFASESTIETLTTRFLARAQLKTLGSDYSSSNTALILLRGL